LQQQFLLKYSINIFVSKVPIVVSKSLVLLYAVFYSMSTVISKIFTLLIFLYDYCKHLSFYSCITNIKNGWLRIAAS
jgi:hypothetical protein